VRWISRRRHAAEPRSIYEHVSAHLRHDGPGLIDDGDDLPDEELLRAEWRGMGWVPGGLEGAFARYGGVPEAELVVRRADELHMALLRLVDRPGRRTRAQVRRLFREGDVRTVVDPLLERLRTQPPQNEAVLYEEMKRLLLESGYRDEVKFAIAIVSAFGDADDAEIFRTLARHEEFTLYAAVALTNVVDDPVQEWLHLLPQVSGWGKTELSELLLQEPEPRPEVCDKVLRQGLGIGNALSLAIGCRLHQALAEPEIDDELLEGAREIFDGLTWSMESPDDLFDFPDAGLATERLLAHLAPRAETLDHFLTVYELRRFLEPPSAEEDARLAELFGGEEEALDVAEHERRRAQAGFDPGRLQRVYVLCSSILDRPRWPWLAQAALESSDERARDTGIEAAKRLGLPLHEYLVSQIEAHPNDSTLWFEFVWGASEERINEAIRLAERVLDLDAVATGPALELIGPPEEEGPHQAFEFVLQELDRFPGTGWSLLRCALRSPVVRHRLGALRALSHWPPDGWAAEMRAGVEECLEDPDDEVRAAAGAVLAGEPIPEPDFDLEDESP
jgi:hypothetical protein